MSAVFGREALTALRITTGCIGSRGVDDVWLEASDEFDRAAPSEVRGASVADLAGAAVRRVLFRRVPALGVGDETVGAAATGRFLATGFLAADASEAVFVVEALLVVAFLATTFFATAFFATVFLATAFLATTFLATVFLAVAFLAAVFFAAATGFFAAAAFLAVFFFEDDAAARLAGAVLLTAVFLLDFLAAKRWCSFIRDTACGIARTRAAQGSTCTNDGVSVRSGSYRGTAAVNPNWAPRVRARGRWPRERGGEPIG